MAPWMARYTAIYRYIPIYCNIRCYAPMYAAFRLSSERKQSSRLGLGSFLTNLVQGIRRKERLTDNH